MESEARLFLEALFGCKPEHLYILIWTLADKRSHWFRKIDDAIQFVESLHDQDVYVETGLSSRDHGPFNRCKSNEVAGSVGVWIDIDLRSDVHPNTTLPSTIEEALSILPPEFPPSFVIRTGNGVHAWYLFRETAIFENDEARKGGARLAKRWNTLIRDNARMKGWAIDRLGDLARVLRIPGTTNCKDPANPKPVVTHTHTDHRYNPSDLTEYLDDLGVPDDDASEAAGQQWAQRFQDLPLTINLGVTIPQEQLDKWIASDSRFEKTWFRQRNNLKDQSQSGYDLALADFGFRAGLSEQGVVDLIVYHRRIHRQKPRAKLDYFYRTLSTSLDRKENTSRFVPSAEPAPFAAPMDSETGSAEQNPGSGQHPKSDREKIELYKKISAAFGIEVLRMVKLSGDDPLYRMDLADGSISFTVKTLISYAAVRTAVAGKVGKLIPPFKRPMWSMLVQMMLDACIVEDGGEELESHGAARLQIGQYLAETVFIAGVEGQSQQDLRKPMVQDGQIAVCASDLQLYINTRSPSVSVQAVVAMLSAAGAKVERVRGRRFKEQSRWMLPVDQFDPADYDSSAPGGSTEHG